MSVFKVWFNSMLELRLFQQGYQPCPCCGAWHSKACECFVFMGLCLTHDRKRVVGPPPRFWDSDGNFDPTREEAEHGVQA